MAEHFERAAVFLEGCAAGRGVGVFLGAGRVRTHGCLDGSRRRVQDADERHVGRVWPLSRGHLQLRDEVGHQRNSRHGLWVDSQRGVERKFVPEQRPGREASVGPEAELRIFVRRPGRDSPAVQRTKPHIFLRGVRKLSRPQSHIFHTQPDRAGTGILRRRLLPAPRRRHGATGCARPLSRAWSRLRPGDIPSTRERPMDRRDVSRQPNSGGPILPRIPALVGHRAFGLSSDCARSQHRPFRAPEQLAGAVQRNSHHRRPVRFRQGRSDRQQQSQTVRYMDDRRSGPDARQSGRHLRLFGRGAGRSPRFGYPRTRARTERAGFSRLDAIAAHVESPHALLDAKQPPGKDGEKRNRRRTNARHPELLHGWIPAHQLGSGPVCHVGSGRIPVCPEYDGRFLWLAEHLQLFARPPLHEGWFRLPHHSPHPCPDSRRTTRLLSAGDVHSPRGLLWIADRLFVREFPARHRSSGPIDRSRFARPAASLWRVVLPGRLQSDPPAHLESRLALGVSAAVLRIGRPALFLESLEGRSRHRSPRRLRLRRGL